MYTPDCLLQESQNGRYALPHTPGLLGVALSGAGPSIVALVNDNDREIGAQIESCFRAHQIESTVRTLDVDNDGCRVI